MKVAPTKEDDILHKEIIQWGCNYLLSHGDILKSKIPEYILSTPWSYVVRFITLEGYIYLKQIPKLLALEANIIQLLHDHFHASVPEIIAHNNELNCFLMKDAGRSLREVLKKKFNAALACKAIDQFTSLQLAIADHINILLDIGVPDWRLDKLPGLFGQLLDQKDILISDGLSELDIAKLRALLPKISTLCEKLSIYSIKESIVQPDFHDNNLLINEITQAITLIDLGEIVISHPFFSLVTFLSQAKKHHHLTDKDKAYQQLMDACFKNYLPFESKRNLLEAFRIAHILWFIYWALAHYRLIVACGKERLLLFLGLGKLSGPLKEFLAAMS